MSKSNKKLRTIVFGSTFGQFYLEALKLLENFEIVGLFANGSERSQQCAELYNIPLLTDINEIKAEEVDLACIVLRSGVMGGKGTEFAIQCMEKGIHVIQEHPIHHQDLCTCLRIAKANRVHFITGNLYIHLPAFKRFQKVANYLLQTRKILYLDIALATQVSFPLVQMIIGLLNNPRPFEIMHVIKEDAPFQIIVGKWGNIPLTLRAHNEVNPNDPDNHQHLLHSISIGCSGGTLSLTDTHGPVVWKTQLHVPTKGLLKEYDVSQSNLDEKSTLILGPKTTMSYKNILKKLWPKAIAEDLKQMLAFIKNEQNPSQRVHLELLCTQQWQQLTSALGSPVLKPEATFEHVEVKKLISLSEEIPSEEESD